MAADRLSRILGELSAEGGGGWASARLCEVTREVIGVSGAGVMLMSGDVPGGSLCTTGHVSDLIEDLQYTLGEGPCVDAFRQDRVVLEPDLEHPDTPRWLAFTPQAVEAGVRAMFAFPVQVGAVRLGALNLYRDGPGPLTDDQHADALVMADVIARWVLDVQTNAPTGTMAEELEQDADSTSSCTTPPARCRFSSGPASPRRSSVCGRTPSATTFRCVRLPKTWWPGGFDSDDADLEATHRNDVHAAGPPVVDARRRRASGREAWPAR